MKVQYFYEFRYGGMGYKGSYTIENTRTASAYELKYPQYNYYYKLWCELLPEVPPISMDGFYSISGKGRGKLSGLRTYIDEAESGKRKRLIAITPLETKFKMEAITTGEWVSFRIDGLYFLPPEPPTTAATKAEIPPEVLMAWEKAPDEFKHESGVEQLK